jgi:Uma2 family endonuclease
MSTDALTEPVVYPDSDGLPMAENTVQFRWITKLVGGLQTMFRDDPNTFVAGDLFWYPVEGSNKLRVAPDALVAIGRPKGDRGSYRQWVEGGIAPQVVFEVLSPGNTADEMDDKLRFYDRYGVEEYYVIDPDAETVEGWQRAGGHLAAIATIEGWVSPRLGIRFVTEDFSLCVIGPDGRVFEDYVEVAERAIFESRRADQADRRAEKLAEKLRALGIDPDE